MDIFQEMPQKPHFRPLKKYIGLEREGHALGHMITFSTLVETTRNSKLGTPTSCFEDILKVLANLKLHGFDVRKVQTRVELLLKKKDSQGSLNKTSEIAKGKLIKVTVEVGEHEAELDKVTKDINKVSHRITELRELVANLNDKHDSLTKKKLEAGFRITNLQKKADSIDKCTRS
ncbi:hypothetical protein GIB67_000372 [Kingdonia uniflora]|uniref:Uncharacterized protein n=1 Tax=Kingdonia uniflora TaxID=39325 RepID=A0A7J7LKQ4_9MAGN|nr:hypothetical protein GIB67_000372 [Kingdonia uniflora]